MLFYFSISIYVVFTNFFDKKNPLKKEKYLIDIISGTMMTCGDIIAQFTVDKRKLSELDLKRTLRFTILGSCVVVSTCISI